MADRHTCAHVSCHLGSFGPSSLPTVTYPRSTTTWLTHSDVNEVTLCHVTGQAIGGGGGHNHANADTGVGPQGRPARLVYGNEPPCARMGAISHFTVRDKALGPITFRYTNPATASDGGSGPPLVHIEIVRD
jgi:hypothetical protein